MIQGTLFTRDFLLDGIKETADWKALDAAAVAALVAAAKAAFIKFPVGGRPSETQTEDDLIYPVLDALGWGRETWIAQVPAAQKGRADVPDMLLFASPEDKRKANAERIAGDRYRFGLAIVENKSWGVALDRAGKGRAAREGVPSNQILRYLSAAETQSDRRIQWGILTNGRHWRLYWQQAKSRAEEFVEIDLPALLGIKGADADLFAPKPDEREHWIKVFLLLFRRPAFLPSADGRSFHQLALAEGRLWEERVAKDLSELVFTEVFPALVRGLAAGDPKAPRQQPDRAYLTTLRESALILLYRLLFMLYAEDRNLLPVRSESYDDYALRRMREEVAERKDRKDRFAAGMGAYYAKLKLLFRAIAQGEPSLGVPPYNGGLFEPGEGPLLERAELADAVFADVLDSLSRHKTDDRKRWINYRDLSVQQLGSIYEQLLEFDLAVVDGAITVAENDAARKRSGSYYTPEELVGLIIDRTVGPLLRERHEAFVAKAKALAKERRPRNERIKELSALDPATRFLDLKVCDPAMGSGHFLVSLIDYLADRVLEAMADAAALVDWAEDDEPYVSPLARSIANVRKHILDQAKKSGWTVAEGHLDDRLIVRRMILKRVVHGVDLNPMAVELAKVALWLHTFTVGAPLSFLDHHLRCGNSLFGEWVREVEDELAKRGAIFLNRSVQQAKNSAAGMARIERLTDADIAEVRESALAFGEIEEATGPLARFLDFHHALRWLAPLNNDQKRGIQAFHDRLFGDPVRVASGLDAPAPPAGAPQGDLLDPAEPAPTLLPVKGLDDARAHAAFVELLAKARLKAAQEQFLHWQAAYPGIWQSWESRLGDGGWDGGFDAVIGNPPYVRQEMLAAIKPILKGRFASYEGTADLYVYFYEQGLTLLRPGGRLSYVVTNKWMRAGYGEALRRLFGEKAWLETIVDFGHAKQFFADADVFPCVIVAQRPVPELDAPAHTRIAVIKRETLRMEALGPQIDREGYDVERARFGADAWMLEPPGVARLMDKIRAAGVPLAEYAGLKPYRGILTGFNEAFLIDTPTKERLIAADPRASEIIKPYLRGQDIERWHSPPSGMWMIVMRSSGDHAWPWADAPDETDAEQRFSASMPALHAHFKSFEAPLRKRQDHGRWWWELRACAYYDAFEQPKIIYQEIQFHPQYAIDRLGALGNNKTFLLTTDRLVLVAILNSPLMWWFNWRYLPHMKDEALTPQAVRMEVLPIATPDETRAATVSKLVAELVIASKSHTDASRTILDWLRVEHGIDKPSRALQAPIALSADDFVKEAKKAKKSLSAAALKSLRAEYERTIAPARTLAVEAQANERRLSDLVNAAYGLTPDDVHLMWQTAPPRMPLKREGG